jgi:hypothetical protein
MMWSDYSKSIWKDMVGVFFWIGMEPYKHIKVTTPFHREMVMQLPSYHGNKRHQFKTCICIKQAFSWTLLVYGHAACFMACVFIVNLYKVMSGKMYAVSGLRRNIKAVVFIGGIFTPQDISFETELHIASMLILLVCASVQYILWFQEIKAWKDEEWQSISYSEYQMILYTSMQHQNPFWCAMCD